MIVDHSVICPVFIGRENDLYLLDRLMAQSQGGHGQVAYGDMGLSAVAVDSFDHSDPQNIKDNGEDPTGHDDGNNPCDHGRGRRIPDGGRAVAALETP